MFHAFTVELPIATGIGDATKQTAAMRAVVAKIIPNREAGVFLKSAPFRCHATFASPTHDALYRFSTSRIFADRFEQWIGMRTNSVGSEAPSVPPETTFWRKEHAS
jgi:hypothetical protein